MSELSEIRDSLNKMNMLLTSHIAATEEYRKSRDKVIDAHSEALWDDGDSPGALTKLDRLIQKDHQRTWFVRMIAAAVIGLGLDRIWHLITIK
jgi:hypothetical protein